MSPGSDIILVLQRDGLHHIFLSRRYKSPERASARPLGHYLGCCGHTAVGPAVSQMTGTAPLSLSLPSAQAPAGYRDSLGTACSVAESRFRPSDWIHLTVSQLEASLRVRDKPSHFGFTDGEAEAQESAFCLGPRNSGILSLRRFSDKSLY